jgi:hypothetical protein
MKPLNPGFKFNFLNLNRGDKSEMNKTWSEWDLNSKNKDLDLKLSFNSCR